MNAPDPNAFSLDMNDPEDAELVEFFLSELPSRVDTIIAAFSNDDFAELARVAHQLKGAAPGFGFPTIGAQACKLEQEIKQVSDPSESLETLRSEVDQLVSLCNSYINPG